MALACGNEGVVDGAVKSPQPPFTKGGLKQGVPCLLLAGLAYGEFGALEGAFALFERLGESENLFVGLGV